MKLTGLAGFSEEFKLALIKEVLRREMSKQKLGVVDSIKAEKDGYYNKKKQQRI